MLGVGLRVRTLLKVFEATIGPREVKLSEAVSNGRTHSAMSFRLVVIETLFV